MKFPKSPRIILSPTEWRRLKEYVLARDVCCVNCGSHSSATPAHVKRRTQNGNDAPNNLVVLCVDCHRAFDQYEIDLPQRVYEMLDQEQERLEKK